MITLSRWARGGGAITPAAFHGHGERGRRGRHGGFHSITPDLGLSRGPAARRITSNSGDDASATGDIPTDSRAPNGSHSNHSTNGRCGRFVRYRLAWRQRGRARSSASRMPTSCRARERRHPRPKPISDLCSCSVSFADRSSARANSCVGHRRARVLKRT